MATPFVIWFEGRSGSSLLVSLLSAHDQILCRREDFSGYRLDSKDKNPATDEYDFDTISFEGLDFRRRLSCFGKVVLSPSESQCLDHLNEIFSKPVSAAGFKFKHPRQHGIFPEVARQLVDDRDQIRLICLRRNNLLKRAISKQNLTKVKQHSGRSNLESPLPIGKLVVDVSKAIEFCQRVQQRQGVFNAWARQFPKVCDIEYETLLHQRTTVMKDVADFLEVEPIGNLESNLLKTTRDNLKEAVANYEELASELHGTFLEKYLQD